MTRSYSELCQIPSFEDRIIYLMLNGEVGLETFGVDRIFNQMFYRSAEWQYIRHKIILRDEGCDLGVPDQEIIGEPILIHHINPIYIEDIESGDPKLLDEDNLISTRKLTHNIIHYGYQDKKPLVYHERYKNDTCPWKNRRKF